MCRCAGYCPRGSAACLLLFADHLTTWCGFEGHNYANQSCKSLPGFMLQPPPRGQQVVQVGGEEEVEEDNSKCRLDFSMFPLCQVWAKLVVPAFERVLEGWKEALQNPPSASSNTGTTTDVSMSRVCLVSNMDSRANKLINLSFSK